MSGPVPAEWTRVIANLRAAQVAWDTMKSPAATQIARDEATVTYSRAADQIITDLGALSERHVLGSITLHLAKKERR